MAGMDRASFRTESVTSFGDQKNDLDARFLRNKLVNLTLDWELAALTLDSQRYKSNASMERESLRDAALAYRKCISELTEILAASSILARTKH